MFLLDRKTYFVGQKDILCWT